MSKLGRLVLCSSGSGDPDLLPVKTVVALGEASLALYPDSTPREIVELIAPAARCETFPLTSAFVPGERTWADVRAEVARGGTVVRLYPDSPQIDQNALREARMLLRGGVQFEVVNEPIVALQAACYAGIPLDLDRGTVALMSERSTSTLNATGTGTAIVMMGRMERPYETAQQLVRCGYSSRTPCMIIRRPASPSQQILDSHLGLVSSLRDPSTGGVLVAGEALRQRDGFSWHQNLPLYGKRVLVTRARGQAGVMSARLRQLGAEPVELPAIEIEPPSNAQPLDDAITHLRGYDWIIFTSVNGVAAFFERLDTSDTDVRALGSTRIAAIGSATAAELRAHGLKADFVPERYVAEEVLAGLLERGAGRGRILLPRAERAREVLPQGLRDAGATVDVVAVYRTVAPEPSPVVLQRILDGEIDIVTLTSSSTARNLAAMLGGRLEPLEHARIACIGPVTAETASQVGFHIDVVAQEFTIPGLIAAVVAVSKRSTS